MEPAGTPLEQLVEPVRYVIQVTDEDGMELDRPIEGVIRVYADQPPQIFASAKVQLVVPKARPTIDFQVADDFGLAQIKILSEVVHANGGSGEKGEVAVYTLSAGQAAPQEYPGQPPAGAGPAEGGEGRQDQGGRSGRGPPRRPAKSRRERPRRAIRSNSR